MPSDSLTGVVVGLHVNANGGVPKHPVSTLQVHTQGCTGDRQNDRRHHGGPDRAVCLMAKEVLTDLVADGHPISPGSTGENLLIAGIEPKAYAPGVRLNFNGDVVLEITTDAPPCKTIAASFIDGTFRALSHKRQPSVTRWYARVVEEGTLVLGQSVSRHQ